MAGERKEPEPVCVNAPCPMTMGYYMGGGQYICWLHAMTVPGCMEAARNQQQVCLVRTK